MKLSIQILQRQLELQLLLKQQEQNRQKKINQGIKPEEPHHYNQQLINDLQLTIKTLQKCQDS